MCHYFIKIPDSGLATKEVAFRLYMFESAKSLIVENGGFGKKLMGQIEGAGSDKVVLRIVITFLVRTEPQPIERNNKVLSL